MRLCFFLVFLCPQVILAELPEPDRSLTEINVMLSKHNDEIISAFGTNPGPIKSITSDTKGYVIKSKKCTLRIKRTYEPGFPPQPMFKVEKCKPI